jgi:hypothetical protein
MGRRSNNPLAMPALERRSQTRRTAIESESPKNVWDKNDRLEDLAYRLKKLRARHCEARLELRRRHMTTSHSKRALLGIDNTGE